MAYSKSKFKHSDLTGVILGCSFDVYNELGMGFPEKIYQRCLELELKEKGISLNREFSIPVRYKGKLVGKRRLDFVIEDKVIIELKSRPYIHKSDFIQIRNYLKVAKIEVGLLINFGSSSLEYRRCIETIR